MVRGRRTLREQYKPYLVSLFAYTGNVEVELTHEFSQVELLQITADDVSRWFMWKAYGTPTPGPEDNPTDCCKNKSRYMMRTVVPLHRNYPDCVNAGEVLGGSNFIIQVVITTPRGGLSLL